MAAAVTILTGGEDLLVERATRSVVDQAAALAQPQGAEVVVREYPVAALELQVWDEVLAPTLFPTLTVLVVTSLADAADGAGDQMLELAQHPVPQLFVVLHQKANAGKKLVDALAKAPHAATVACAPIKTRRDKLRFLKEEFRAHRRRATDEAVEYLLDAVGADLRELVSAVDQLVADTSGLVEQQTVAQYYTGRAEVTGFAVADRALEGHPGPALEQLRWALQCGTDPVLIVSALASGVRMLVAVASAPAGTSPAALASSAGVPSWKVDQLRRQARGWTPHTIAAALAQVADADAAIKGAGTDPAYALEHTILRLAALRG